MQEHHSFHDSSVNLNYPKTEFVKKLKACSNIHELNEEAMKIISQHEWNITSKTEMVAGISEMCIWFCSQCSSLTFLSKCSHHSRQIERVIHWSWSKHKGEILDFLTTKTNKKKTPLILFINKATLSVMARVPNFCLALLSVICLSWTRWQGKKRSYFHGCRKQEVSLGMSIEQLPWF